ncbi:DNA adenine methylase [Helicobacter ailurogastricus]|uniref:DNA adenine methylase n=1 Tax=Helicobacter ailurogastricus TaxID=1578720 RepID=UPI000CF0E12C|nr:DNA adenine methylase [Helicobacter ailurogastricus]
MIQSPLNYTGGKFRLLPQILPKLPPNIHTFYDIFCGGFNVGVNVRAHRVVGVDKNPALIELLAYIQSTPNLEQQIDQVITKHGLSQSYLWGYSHYNTTSNTGLSTHNKPAFLRLRESYNQSKEPLLLLVLLIFAFNNQMRFNAVGDFNLPVGKRDFNARLRRKLGLFQARIQESSFLCMDFRAMDLNALTANDFLYLDPPYLLGCASYNENGGWSVGDELDLLHFLKRASHRGIKFALSNVLAHKGAKHGLLLEWCKTQRWHIHPLKHSYANSSYQAKHKHTSSQEVLVTNYVL